MRKYEFTREVIQYCGVTLHRIRSLISFNNVAKGELGGFVEKEENLSQYEYAWVYGDAMVYSNAWIYGNARVYGNSCVSGNAMVSGDAYIAGNAMVYGDAYIYGNAMVSDNATVYGNAVVSDNARVYGDAMIAGDARVYGNARVSGDASVYGNAWVHGYTSLYANADVFRTNHYLNIGAIGSRFDFTTFYRDLESGIMVSCGCFLGKLEEFKEKVKETHGDNKYAQVYFKACGLAEVQINV